MDVLFRDQIGRRKRDMLAFAKQKQTSNIELLKKLFLYRTTCWGL